jgi:beta-phosphoglucomutase-like phosphatase (HAD superfamily)
LQENCRPRVILLDLDGTVIDTMGAYADIASRLLEEKAGVPGDRARKLYLSTAGMAFRDQLRVIGVPEGLIEEIARLFEEEKKGVLSDLEIPREVERFTMELRRRGLRVALSTNNECSVIRSMRGLNGLFDLILCHDPERRLRKGLDHVRELREAFGVRECEIVFVGDSDYDIRLYKGLGVRVLRTAGLWRDAQRVMKMIDAMIK